MEPEQPTPPGWDGPIEVLEGVLDLIPNAADQATYLRRRIAAANLISLTGIIAGGFIGYHTSADAADTHYQDAQRHTACFNYVTKTFSPGKDVRIAVDTQTMNDQQQSACGIPQTATMLHPDKKNGPEIISMRVLLPSPNTLDNAASDAYEHYKKAHDKIIPVTLGTGIVGFMGFTLLNSMAQVISIRRQRRNAGLPETRYGKARRLPL